MIMTVMAIKNATSESQLNNIMTLIKTSDISSMPLQKLQGELSMPTPVMRVSRAADPDPTRRSAVMRATGGDPTRRSARIAAQAETVLKSKYDKLQRDYEKCDTHFKLLRAECKDTDKKLREAKAKLKALEGAGGGDLARALADKDQYEKDYNALLKTSDEEIRELGKTIDTLNKELTAALQGSNKGIVEENEKLRTKLQSTKEALDRCKEIKSISQKEVIDLENKLGTAVRKLENALLKLNTERTTATGAKKLADQLGKDLDTMEQSGKLNKALLTQCRADAKALREKLSASNLQVDQSQRENSSLAENIKQMQALSESKEQDEVRRTLKSTAIDTAPEGWKSMESLGFKNNDNESKDELFMYARSSKRLEHIYYNNRDNKFVEDTKSSKGLYFNTDDLLEYKRADYDSSEVYVNVEEYMQFNLVPVYPLTEDERKESQKNPPEGFQILRNFSNYAGVFNDSTERAEKDLFEFIEAKGNRVTVFVLEPDIGTGYIFSTPVWFPVTAIREKFGNTPFFLEYTRSDRKEFLRGGNTNPLTLYQIAVNKDLYNDFLNTRGSTIVEVNGEKVEVGSSGQRANKKNTVKGMFIKSENSSTVYEILQKKNGSWKVRNTTSNKESSAKYRDKYRITDKPTEVEVMARRLGREKKPPASGFETGDVVEMGNQLYIVQGGNGFPAKKDPAGYYVVDIDKRGTKKLTSDAILVLSKEDNIMPTARRKRLKTKRPLLEQPLRVMSYGGIEGKVPALPMVRIPEPHEL